MKNQGQSNSAKNGRRFEDYISPTLQHLGFMRNHKPQFTNYCGRKSIPDFIKEAHFIEAKSVGFQPGKENNRGSITDGAVLSPYHNALADPLLKITLVLNDNPYGWNGRDQWALDHQLPNFKVIIYRGDELFIRDFNSAWRGR